MIASPAAVCGVGGASRANRGVARGPGQPPTGRLCRWGGRIPTPRPRALSFPPVPIRFSSVLCAGDRHINRRKPAPRYAGFRHPGYRRPIPLPFSRGCRKPISQPVFRHTPRAARRGAPGARAAAASPGRGRRQDASGGPFLRGGGRTRPGAGRWVVKGVVGRGELPRRPGPRGCHRTPGPYVDAYGARKRVAQARSTPFPGNLRQRYARPPDEGAPRSGPTYGARAPVEPTSTVRAAPKFSDHFPQARTLGTRSAVPLVHDRS